MSRPYRLRLFDSLNAIAVSERATERGFEAFQENEFARLATERALEIMSEASRHIGEQDKAAHPDVGWLDLADLGNVIRHGYDRVTADRVFRTVTTYVPLLKPVMVDLYARHKSPSDPWPDAAPDDPKAP